METIQDLLADHAKLDELTTEVFTQVDTDGSGLVSKSELRTAMRKIAEESGIPLPTEEEVHKVMTALDVDQSGSLTKEEFKVLLVEALTALTKA
jgi:Ca2+-binding EF-hand superfamily protein